MRILAIEPYYGGSHRAFIDGWSSRSEHEFELLTLPPHHWKWRMRHAAVSVAARLPALAKGDRRPWELCWSSSMLNLAELRGLCPELLGEVPCVSYFHENQLAYPSQQDDPRDVHFALTHWVSLLAANEAWFNSAYNRDTLLDGLERLFRQLPDHRGGFDRDLLEAKCRVEPPGVDVSGQANCASGGDVERTSPLRIAWAARWEHDKGPELLLDALQRLEARGVDYRLSLLGEGFKDRPSAFTQLQQEFAARLEHAGFLPERGEYLAVLARADVFVSTAHHEFFGISVMEAALLGCRLLVPHRLVYPELFGDADVFYDGSAQHLAARLAAFAQTPRLPAPTLCDALRHYEWTQRAAELDRRVAELGR